MSGVVEEEEYSDETHLLRSTNDHDHEGVVVVLDIEQQQPYAAFSSPSSSSSSKPRRHSFKRLLDRTISSSSSSSVRDRDRDPVVVDADPSDDAVLTDAGAPPEWVLLLLGCLLGLATGLFVAAFNKGVHVIHEWAWAGTPSEGAAWLRLQRLADTWHRILLIPVTGGVIVGMMHGLLEILDQIRQSISNSNKSKSQSQRQGFDFVAAVFPTIKAIQAAVTLGTGCSLGPEGPSVDIGTSCAKGFSVMMDNSSDRELALLAAGAAAGIASGFNAAVAGCFFAIETVLRSNKAENSPPFTTAMIILASVISSTVSNVSLGTQSAFTVPAYDLKSAAAFTRLVTWFTNFFDFIKEKFGLPAVVCPALGGLGAGIIALKYPGILYWGFTNVEEILRTGNSASAPGIWLLTQLSAAKVVATALCKGSGLVGMAATLASVCSVPLTSVLLLFELTKDYRILLPLMGAVGLAIWVPSVTNQAKDSKASDARSSVRGYASLSLADDKDDGGDLELSVIENGADIEALDKLLEKLEVSQAMSKSCVKVSLEITLKEARDRMDDNQQTCVLVVDEEGLLEGILTCGDIRRYLSKKSSDDAKSDSRHLDVSACLVSSVCTRGLSYRGRERGLLTCYPDTNLAVAKELMEAKGIKQLPVVKRGVESNKERKRRIIALLHYDSIWNCLRCLWHQCQAPTVNI
ncbi:chloride channel protein clc-f [Quercus suber]|uniref:Chloride channel protein n=1 Tax=Quercus suber TaxID=58331 RepID=A0AAW0LCN2_QUESU